MTTTTIGSDDDDDELEAVAGLSSAAACIELNLLDSNSDASLSFSFKPVFTHQCYENEAIQGFAPFLTEALEATDIASK